MSDVSSKFSLAEQERRAEAAFSKQSAEFDSLEEKNPTLRWMRTRIRRHVLSLLRPGDEILELNAGTGLDAVFFGRLGFRVHATDIAEGMVERLRDKTASLRLEKLVTTQRLSYHRLPELGAQRYDYVFSNFGGLNCAPDLKTVIRDIKSLIKPGGYATFALMPPVCPWEIFSVLRGNANAFRRLKKGGAWAHIEGEYFKTYYYTARFVERAFGQDFERVALLGLASVAPPPHIGNAAKRYPRILRALERLDERLASLPPFRSCADHILLTLRKRLQTL